MTHTLRLSGPAEIAAAVPSLLGFHPAVGDLVVITMAGARIGLTMRVATRMLNDDVLGQTIADAIVRARESQPIERAVLVGYADTDSHDGVDTRAMRAVAAHLEARDVTVSESLRVIGNVVQCTSGCTHDLPATSVVEVATVVETGRVTAGSRDELAKRVEWSGSHSGGAEHVTVADWHWRLRDVPTRDAALAVLAGDTADRLAVSLEQLCTTARHTGPGGDRDAVLTVTAFAAYLSGDGAMARVALGGVSASYSLANLLTQCLDAAVPPQDLRTLALAAVELEKENGR